MRFNRTLWAMCAATALIAGCKKEQARDDVATAATTAPAAATQAVSDESAAAAPAAASNAPGASAPQADAVAFDITRLPVSQVALPAWPYVALPAGYYANLEVRENTKDLARVPIWTGAQLLWVEGKTFEAGLYPDEGKTFSRFELLKGVDQALTALGAVKLAERSVDGDTYRANEVALNEFRSEFDDIDSAYGIDEPAATYVIRRADTAVWVVVQSGTSSGALMVVDAPVPSTP